MGTCLPEARHKGQGIHLCRKAFQCVQLPATAPGLQVTLLTDLAGQQRTSSSTHLPLQFLQTVISVQLEAVSATCSTAGTIPVLYRHFMLR